MLRLSHITVTGLLLLGLSANSHAEVVELPTTQPSNTTEFSVQLPGRGMSMEMVLNRFDEPLEKEPAVGEPPITKWSYKNFTVYFESQFVIHAVVNN